MIRDLEEFKTCNQAMALGEDIWSIVSSWNYFEKDTVGKQLIRAVDSIAANLSEGFGSYHHKEIKNFSYYSRGSLFETRTWITKANKRNLIIHEQFKQLISNIETIGKMLKRYINSIGSSSNDIKEPESEYITLTPNP